MVRFYIKSFIILLIIGCSTNNSESSLDEKTVLTSKIDSIINQSENKSYNDSIKFSYALKAMSLSEKKGIDSLTIKSLFQLVKLSYPIKTKDSFLHYYPKSLSFSKQIGDTLHIAQIHNFTAFFYLKHNVIDSAYHHFYQGSKFFKFLGNNYQTGKMLLNMAIIQKNKRDYKGSEEVTNDALKYLEKTDKTKFIASAFNNIGIINDELKKLSIAIKYHKKALSLFKTLENEPILVVESLNNIAAAYKDNNNYEKAFAYFDSIQPYEKLLEDYPIVNARIIDNKAHARLLSGNIKGVLKDMEKALSLRKQEHHLTGIMVSHLHLSEYYRLMNNPEKSFQYALEAKNLSSKYQNLRDVLKALRVLILNKLNAGNTDFIEEYYDTLDTVEKVENSVADGFARIRLEADKNEKEKTLAKKQVQEQEQEIRNNEIVITLTIGIIFLLVVVLFLIWKSSKHRKELYKEFSHRTKQNLTSIKRGVLKLKVGRKNSDQIKELEASTESQLILHSLLEQSNYPAKVDLSEYFKVLMNTLLLIYPDFVISKEVNLMHTKMSSKKTSLIGKILTEFITNAFKHGFSNEIENSIETTLKVTNRKEADISVIVSGKQWNPESSLGKGEGMLLMYNLSKKIPAELYIRYKENKTTLNLKI